MKELELKTEQLYQKLGNIISSIEKINNCIEHKKAEKEDYFNEELMLNDYKKNKKDIINKIWTLDEAVKILKEK